VFGVRRPATWVLMMLTFLAITGTSGGATLPTPLACTFKGSITYNYLSGGPGSDWYDYQLEASGSGSCAFTDGSHPARPPKYQPATFSFRGAMDPLAYDPSVGGPNNPFPLNTCPNLGPIGFFGTITSGGTVFGVWLNSIYDYPGIHGEMPFEVRQPFQTTGYGLMSTRIFGACAPAMVPPDGSSWTDKMALTLGSPLQNLSL